MAWEDHPEKVRAALEMEAKTLNTDLESTLASISGLRVLGSAIPVEWKKEDDPNLAGLAVSDVFDSSHYLKPLLPPLRPLSQNIEIGTPTLDKVFVGSFRDTDGQLQLVARLDVGMEMHDDDKDRTEHVPLFTHYVSTTIPPEEETYFLQDHQQRQEDERQRLADKAGREKLFPDRADYPDPGPTLDGAIE